MCYFVIPWCVPHQFHFLLYYNLRKGGDTLVVIYSIHTAIHVHICPHVVCLYSIHEAFCVPIVVPACLSVCPFTHISDYVCLSVHPYISPAVWLSVPLSVSVCGSLPHLMYLFISFKTDLIWLDLPCQIAAWPKPGTQELPLEILHRSSIHQQNKQLTFQSLTYPTHCLDCKLSFWQSHSQQLKHQQTLEVTRHTAWLVTDHIQRHWL